MTNATATKGDSMTTIKETLATLTTGDQQVLTAVLTAAKDNGYDFAFGEDVRVDGMTRSQIGGHLSSLIKKGLFTAENDGESDGTSYGCAMLDFDGTLDALIAWAAR